MIDLTWRFERPAHVVEFPTPDSERFLVLVNPRAAGGQPAALRRRIGGAMAARGVPFDIVETSTPEEGLTVARAAALRGYRAVVAAGGDGTIALALRGTAGTTTPVAILPFGTGNQLALNFGIPLSLEEAVRVAVEGATERIDLGRIGDERFALIAGAGLDASVMAETTSEMKSQARCPRVFLCRSQERRDREADRIPDRRGRPGDRSSGRDGPAGERRPAWRRLAAGRGPGGSEDLVSRMACSTWPYSRPATCRTWRRCCGRWR